MLKLAVKTQKKHPEKGWMVEDRTNFINDKHFKQTQILLLSSVLMVILSVVA